MATCLACVVWSVLFATVLPASVDCSVFCNGVACSGVYRQRLAMSLLWCLQCVQPHTLPKGLQFMSALFHVLLIGQMGMSHRLRRG